MSCSTDAQAYSNAFFGQGTGVIGVSDTNCDGTEATVQECSYMLNPATCTHSMDAGVRCSGPVGDCEAAGHTTCCTGGGCQTNGCYCDAACHGFGDCCADIANTCPQGLSVNDTLRPKLTHYLCRYLYHWRCQAQQ